MPPPPADRAASAMTGQPLIEAIRRAVIGGDTAVMTPFGLRRVTYADYTASGRSLGFIEDFIRENVLPLYANTHTENSGTARQTTRFREEARSIVREALGASAAEHAVIFTGSGCTGAIDRLIAMLGIRIPAELDERHGLLSRIPRELRPVVFVGPYEHHSNELPWRESIADVVEIPEDADGAIDLAALERRLVEFAARPLRIGSFSAASNVTGIVSDTAAIASLLHAYGALSFWDYAAAAPYLGIDMGSAEGGRQDYKDAIVLSPHKFIGGPGTPGILVVRRELLHNRVPAVPGGGTVSYVNPVEHRYLVDQEHREEGGTPAIVESIRAGLVFQLKQAVGIELIRQREEDFLRRAVASWSANPNLQILGNPEARRLSIVSFVVKGPARHGGAAPRYLHHNFVVALLNDLFGIQARGGCSCAGPYGHRLLGIDLETSRRFEQVVAGGCEGIKPGWVRVSLNYFIPEEEFSFLLEAVHLVAREGWKLLPRYRFDPVSGGWRHVAGVPEPPLSLTDMTFHGGVPAFPHQRHTEPLSRLPEYLAAARQILEQAAPAASEALELPPQAESLRWFLLPAEAVGA